jgi:uncharacterized membrane protein YfcA
VEALLAIPKSALAASLVVVFLAAAVQGVIGLGFAIVSVPILSLVDSRLAPVPQLLLSLPLTLSMAYRERHAIEWRALTWILVGRVPGAFLGMWLLRVASAQSLDAMTGCSVLAGVAVFSTRLQVRRNPYTELFAGIASGTTGMVSSIGGPPLALLYGGEKGETIRANLAALFAIGLFITIGGRVLAEKVQRVDLLLSALMLPALFAGLAISGRFLGKVEGQRLRVSVLIISAAAAIALLMRAVFGSYNSQ